MKDIDRNQYTAYGNKGTKTSILTFLDVLGYRDFVKTPVEGVGLNEKLALLKRSIEKSYNYVRDNVIPEAIDSQRFWETRTFSDNISIFYPIRNEKISIPGHSTCSDKAILALFHVVSLVSYLQMEMIRTGGFFIRGGIAVGEAYVDDNFIFSDGLIEAYDSEAKDAIDPRIILSKSVCTIVQNYIDKGRNGDDFDFLYCIGKDADGLYYVDYLKELTEKGEFSRDLYLACHKEQILKKLEQFKGNSKCLRKYLWSANYHNRFCDSEGMTKFKIEGI